LSGTYSLAMNWQNFPTACSPSRQLCASAQGKRADPSPMPVPLHAQRPATWNAQSWQAQRPLIGVLIRFLPPPSRGAGLRAAAFRTGELDPLLMVLAPVRDPGPAARGTSGPANQEPAQEPVPAPAATSDPGNPEQEQDLAGTALVRVAAEWS